MRYRKKPVVIDAWQFMPDKIDIPEWVHLSWFCEEVIRGPFNSTRRGSPIVQIPTLEGTMTARIGDWIIRGVNGEVYPCKPDIFEKTYEPEEAP